MGKPVTIALWPGLLTARGALPPVQSVEKMMFSAGQEREGETVMMVITIINYYLGINGGLVLNLYSYRNRYFLKLQTRIIIFENLLVDFGYINVK